MPEDRAMAMNEIYTDVTDLLPHNMPEPLGNGIDINKFVDADHAGNKVTRRSYIGVVRYIVTWHQSYDTQRKKNTVESSAFSSEFIALTIVTELLEGLKYKLQIFGVSLNGVSRIFYDDESVVINGSYLDSTLEKKQVLSPIIKYARQWRQVSN